MDLNKRYYYHLPGDITVDLSTKIASLSLPNPTILASGIMDEDSGSMNRILDSGAGAVVTKSIGLKPRTGHPNPTFVELEHGILNAMGLPNPGINTYIDELKEMKSSKGIIIGSIFGSTSEDFVKIARKMNSYVNGFELNLSCPHAEGFGIEIGQNPSLVAEITKAVTDTVTKPVFVKLSAQVNDIVEIGLAAEKAGSSGIVAINTLKAMSINLDLEKPVLGNLTGGYSGEAIKPIGLRSVYELYRNVSIPIIGVGGISTGKDAIEYFMAGATSVQIGTALYLRGTNVFKQICNEIISWMTDHDYDCITDLIGVAHQ